MAALLVPPFKLSSTTTIIPRSTAITTIQGNAGGLTIIGGTASGDDLTLSSTSNATKGNLFFGTSGYDEVNNRLSLKTTGNTLPSGSAAVLFVANETDLLSHVLKTSSATISPNMGYYRALGTLASPTSVVNGTVLGQIGFSGYNTTDADYNDGALIQAIVDGTPGSADLPTRLMFYTTPDGSAGPAEALRISNDKSSRFSGAVTIGGTTAPDAQLDVMCASSSTIGSIFIAAASQTANLTEWQNSSASILTRVSSAGDIQYFQSARTVSGNTAFFDSATSTITVSAAANLFMFRARNTFNLTAAHTVFNFNNFFLHNVTYKNDPSLTGLLINQFNCFVNQGVIQADTNATTACNSASAFLDIQNFSRINSGTLAVAVWNSFNSAPVSATGVTITTRRGLWVQDIAGGTTTNNTGIRIESLANGGTNIAIDMAGNAIFNGAGLLTKYNNIALVSNGVASELATADPTGQAAAIAATTIYTPTTTGLFRISIYLQVTQAATTSSILGGATGVVITYNDGDGNVAQSNTAALATTAGAIAVTAAGNTTATNLEGTLVIYARTGVAIKYAIGYTSVGLTAMQYAAHLKVEAF